QARSREHGDARQVRLPSHEPERPGLAHPDRNTLAVASVDEQRDGSFSARDLVESLERSVSQLARVAATDPHHNHAIRGPLQAHRAVYALEEHQDLICSADHLLPPAVSLS